MEYVIGIDGGGTKTAFALARRQGNILAHCQRMSISYRQYPLREIVARLQDGVQECLAQQNLGAETLAALCVGYPCYGESTMLDKEIIAATAATFPQAKVLFVNDVEVGWAGALNARPGIHVVCGTGAIAFGKNDQGESARCGGWLDFFSDEGSGYWLGRKTMQLFSLQADGREAKGPLYAIIREAFHLNDDLAFIDIMVRDYIPFREKVAQLQLYLAQAAKAGDAAAVRLFSEAAGELARLVETLQKRLQMKPGYHVSYSGGLFKEKELVLKVFTAAIQGIGGTVVPPAGGPLEGAVKLARTLLREPR